MIRKAEIGKEIAVTVINKIGVLADISKILTDHGINIIAVAGYALDNEAKIMFVADDNLRAKEALVKDGYKAAKENSVILLELENKPGALRHITDKMAAQQIDINYIYGTTCPGACPARIVLSTSNDEKALVAFNK